MHVPDEHYSYMSVNTEFSFVFIIFIIICIFYRDLNYIHYTVCYVQCLYIYVMFLTNDVRFVPLLL